MFLVGALCLAAFLLARLISNNGSSSLREATPIPATPSQKIAPMENGLVYYDGMTLHALNNKGKQMWSYAAGSPADFSVDSQGISVWSGTKLTLLSDRGATILSTDMLKPVLSVNLGERYVAIQRGEEHESEIVIIERGGREIDKIQFPDLTVLNYGFFNGGKLFWVLTLNTEGTVPLCMISTYQPGGMRAGTISESDQILYRVIFQSSQIRAVGTKYIRSYDYMAKEKPEDRLLVYGWHAVSIDPGVDNPLMAFVPTEQLDAGAKINDVRLIKGNSERKIRFPIACFSVFVNKDTMYGFSENYVFVTRSGEKHPTAYMLPVTVDRVFGVTGDQSAIVSSGGVVYLVSVPG